VCCGIFQRSITLFIDFVAFLHVRSLMSLRLPFSSLNAMNAESKAELLTVVFFEGYVGRLCDHPDPCDNVTCMNGGTCVNRNGTAKCQCPGPYVGRRCEDRCPANRVSGGHMLSL